MRSRTWAAIAVSLVALLWAGLGHLSTRPADFHDYRTMTVRAAQSAYGAVGTARLTGDALAAGKVTRAYAEAGFADAREALSAAAAGFAGEGPPDDRARKLRDQLAPLLRDAAAALDRLEAARDPAAWTAAAAAAQPVADGLRAFVEEHA
ncbi:hypothetical protein [Asanoa sp. NPDC050611]|uniref:hypothetical protein n=1 Tax=Asanoa sp. NPDC050611 TaxID=3157098 RepID=UPI0033FA89C3